MESNEKTGKNRQGPAKLKPAQVAAIDALLSSTTMSAAAKKAGVADRTLRHWLATDEAFQDALRQAESQVIDHLARRLVAFSDGAITVLASVMVNRDEKTADRVRASDIILGRMLTMTEIRNIERRLADLEALQDGDKNGIQHASTWRMNE